MSISVLRVKDNNGNIIEIPAIKGDKGEPGVKGLDGYTPIKGVDYYTDADKKEILDELKPQTVSFTDGETISVQDNTEYIAKTDITSLTLIYPETPFICSLVFTVASEGDVTITLPSSQYIGGAPTFANGETWELNIKNGVVVGGLVE